MAARSVSDWLAGYLRYTDGSESPTSYHVWTGLSILAGALQRKVYLQWGFETIHSNLYVILVGPSGRARKGVAIGIGKEMLATTSTTMTSEAVTREALIRAMKTNTKNFQDPTTGEIKFHCSVTAFSEELSVFLGQQNISFLSSLTDWYDSKSLWTYETKGSGTDQLSGLCFNLLGATAPDWLQSMLPQEAVGGGFTSRCIFVVEERKGKTVPHHIFTDEEMRIKEGLTRDLEMISQLAGAFQFDAEGEEAYVNWYTEQDRRINAGDLPVPDERFAGYCERRPTHIRKLSMLCSVSARNDLIIRGSDFRRAVGILEATERKMSKTFGGLGTATYSQITERVLEYIRKNKLVSRSILVGRFRRDLDPTALHIVEETLEYMKVVKITRNLGKGEVVYEWIGDE